ncbi:MAG: copper resistance protein B [Planctomycetota bacterium]
MTLDEVLERAAHEPPEDWPHVVADDRFLTYILVDQLEYRARKGRDALGWETEAWLGYDYDKLWVESAGEAMVEGEDEIAVTNEIKYSRLITPFWNFQIGVANELTWTDEQTEDTWAAVVALDGMAPYMFECTPSVELTEDGDVFGAFEAEYNLRITQRLVLQPRTEMEFAAQDMPEEHTGAGLTHVALDLRLRYALRREFAPYIGVRYGFLVGETHSIASARGEDPDAVALLAGMRLAF